MTGYVEMDFGCVSSEGAPAAHKEIDILAICYMAESGQSLMSSLPSPKLLVLRIYPLC